MSALFIYRVYVLRSAHVISIESVSAGSTVVDNTVNGAGGCADCVYLSRVCEVGVRGSIRIEDESVRGGTRPRWRYRGPK